MVSKIITLYPEQQKSVDVTVKAVYTYDDEEPSYAVEVSWWKNTEYCVENFYVTSLQVAQNWVRCADFDLIVSIVDSHQYAN